MGSLIIRPFAMTYLGMQSAKRKVDASTTHVLYKRLMQRRSFIVTLFSLAIASRPAAARSRDWAQRKVLPGVPNFYRVTSQLYRGAQPTAAGFRNLEADIGIRTVVNLHDEAPDETLAPTSHLQFVHVPMNSFRVFSHKGDKLFKALHAIRLGLKLGPVMVHCKHGKDRTGGVMAAWRMVEQGWSAERAIREMNEGGFGYNSWLFGNGRALKRLDVEAMRRRLNAV
jgi:protein tyrosine phosphatase (PTP) superfamily phosphohydrolase (DUF442 family)